MFENGIKLEHVLIAIPSICAFIAGILPAPDEDNDPKWYVTLYDIIRRIGIPSKKRQGDE